MEIERLKKATSLDIEQALSRWDLTESPPTLNNIQSTEKRAAGELAMLNWLYDLVRLNVKRGRIFQLRDVLLHQEADCLGYASLMQGLGQIFSLDIGTVEVLIDNAGRYTPHYVNIVKLSSGKRQFVDMWYGSRDIRHHRIGARVKERGRWRIKDLYRDEIEKVEDLEGLSSSSVDGITYYILGNRHLERGIRNNSREELDKAIAHYSKAINLYPGYARAYYNRAIACENKEDSQKARLDYAQALRDEASQIRVLAREHEDVIKLIALDRANIGIKEQEIYLLRNGFITGVQLTSADIARQCQVPDGAVDAIISTIEARLTLF